MNYVYPKLSDHDWRLFRLGGAGLGNILFTYARAVVFAKKHGCRVIWPTWFSLKLGPILRHEKDKRFYGDLFSNRSGYIGGIRKCWLLATKKKIREQDAEACIGDVDRKVVIFEGFENCFLPILHDSAAVYADIEKNLKKKNRKALAFEPGNAICVHVRLGDFNRATWEEVLNGKHDCSIPIEWYVRMVEEIRKITGEQTKVFVFSDGSDEELAPLLALDHVERICFGSAIADIVALSRARLFIASGSSFSMWARYLGRMTTLMFPNQEKQKILTEEDEGKEITAVEAISPEYYDLIRTVLRKKRYTGVSTTQEKNEFSL